MRTTNRFLGLGFVSTLIVLPACADDGDQDTGTDGDTSASGTSSTSGSSSSTSSTSVGPTSDASGTMGDTTASTTSSGDTTASTTTTSDTTGPTSSTTESGTESSTTTTGDDSADDTGTTEDTTTTETAGDDTDTETTASETADGGDDGADTETTSDDSGAAELEALEDLVSAVCEWGFNCCEAGELAYIIGPYAADQEECEDRLTQLLVESDDNSVGDDEQKLGFLGNDYRELAFSLGYRIRTDRSKAKIDGVKACADAWRSNGCREPADLDYQTCDEDPISRVCQLDKLFEGRLGANEHCNWELAGPHTDIECKYGFTCEAIEDDSHLDPTNYRCVYKGQVGDDCTPPNWHDDTLQDGRGNGSCEWGLYCDADEGKCRERPGEGETCKYESSDNPRVDRMEVPCQHDLYCDPKSDKCVDECKEGYACGPRLRANHYAEQRGRANVSDDLLFQYPTPGNRSPGDSDDTCGAGLTCKPYRNNPRGDDSADKPGDSGYYFGKGTDRFGTTFECRKPGNVNAICDTDADCGGDYYCKKDPSNADWHLNQNYGHALGDLPRRRVEDDSFPHNHKGEDGEHFAEVGRCAERVDSGDACFLDIGFKNPDDAGGGGATVLDLPTPTTLEVDVWYGQTNAFDHRAITAANLREQADSRCPKGYYCKVRSEAALLAADFIAHVSSDGTDLSSTPADAAPLLSDLLKSLESSSGDSTLQSKLNDGDIIGGNGRFLGGECIAKLGTNDRCVRHDDCDPESTAGLCLATNDGENDGSELTYKRCVSADIQKGHTCMPYAGLGRAASHGDGDNVTADQDFSSGVPVAFDWHWAPDRDDPKITGGNYDTHPSNPCRYYADKRALALAGGSSVVDGTVSYPVDVAGPAGFADEFFPMWQGPLMPSVGKVGLHRTNSLWWAENGELDDQQAFTVLRRRAARTVDGFDGDSSWGDPSKGSGAYISAQDADCKLKDSGSKEDDRVGPTYECTVDGQKVECFDRGDSSGEVAGVPNRLFCELPCSGDGCNGTPSCDVSPSGAVTCSIVGAKRASALRWLANAERRVAVPTPDYGASGGETRRYAFMQGMALALRDDWEQWFDLYATLQDDAVCLAKDSDDSRRGGEEGIEEEAVRSDFRYLASHCDSNDPELVCRRDHTDAINGYPFKCLKGVSPGKACDSDPGTHGNGLDTCQPGYECFDGYCRKHLKTGELCKTSDTGNDDDDRTVRCDWHHRRPVTKCIPCPSFTGVTIPSDACAENDDGDSCWINPETGTFGSYIVKYDNGCEKVHADKMCRLIDESSTDMAYCDGVANNN